MNEANVAALAGLLLRTGIVRDGDPRAIPEARAAAEALAARGVLVPTALTKEQATNIGSMYDVGTPPIETSRTYVVEKLEAIAKGQPGPM